MRLALRVLGYGVAGLVILLLLAALYAGITWWRVTSAPLPDYEGDARVAGLSGEVVIRRDEYAIPHIEAQSEADAWFALGFVHAQDRLFQMDFMRRAMSGRLAALMGPPAVRRDRWSLIQQLPDKARRALEAIPDRDRAMVKAYTAGVNAYLRSDRFVRTPEHILLHAEMAEWTPLDSALVGMQFIRTGTDSAYAAELVDEVAPSEDALAVFRPFRSTTPAHVEGTGTPRIGGGSLSPPGQSNAWAVAPSRSASGAPLVANDPHMPVTSPGLNYLAHVSWPGRETAGVTTPGMPGFVIARTQETAWAVTYASGAVDSTDHSLLKRDPDDPDGYLTPEGPRDYAVEKPEIHVRFAPDRTVTIRRSPAGVILSWNNPFADAGYDVARLDQSDVSPCACMLSVMLQVGRARSAMEIRDALSVYRSEPTNLIFADRAGNIGYVMPGGIPERPAEVGGRLRINPDGSPPFTRLIPYEENPMVLNPPSGRLISANQAIAGREYPHYLSVAPRDVNRARRIAELLDARAIHDVDSFRAIQLDTESIAARNLLPVLVQTPPANPADGELLDMLSEWDARFEGDSAGPLIFSAWLGEILDAVFHDELGPMTGLVHGGDNQQALLAVLSGEFAHWCDDRTTEPEESCIDILSTTLTQAREQLAARWGADPRAWRWGQAVAHPAPHIAFRNIPVLGKAFERRMEPAGGPDALTHIGIPWRDGVDPESGYSSPYMRMIVDLADPERALFALNSGQSGHFRSPHYHDLAELLAAGEYVRIDDPGGEARTLRLQSGGEQ